jgi:hypothetical protein
MQGDETKTYYFVQDDIKWFLNPRMAYTLISRLSGNITEDVKRDDIDKWNAEFKEQKGIRDEERRQDEEKAKAKADHERQMAEEDNPNVREYFQQLALQRTAKTKILRKDLPQQTLVFAEA